MNIRDVQMLTWFCELIRMAQSVVSRIQDENAATAPNTAVAHAQNEASAGRNTSF